MKQLIVKFLWLIFGFAGSIGFLIIWGLMPHKSEIDSVWQVIFKLLIFLFIILSIAFFPNRSKYRHLLLIIPSFIFLGFLIPRISYFAYIAIPQHIPNAEMELYTTVYLLIFPAILISMCLAYRLGGGTPGNCIKMSISGVIIFFSGFLDLMWYIINPVGIPEKIQYAHHIKMVIGHYPSFKETIIFAVAHLPLLIGLLLLPLDEWIMIKKLEP